MQSDNRPDPDALLKVITAEEERKKRGKLRIFFGGSAGVGKTYAMLNAAHQLKKEGVDVVVGLVETHSRSDTENLVAGLPMIPPKQIEHRGVSLKEFDIDEAIKRRPSLILIDELAHTNGPGCRHPKRWMDVEEMLAEGIDVYTTLNVQHLESVNDIVASITGIWVKETVPDPIFDKADDITLIDIPSDELLKRLKEGKVYIAQQAKNRAAQNFFKKSNLIALRELALRRTAERVDEQMAEYNTQAGVKSALVPAERIMVCVGPDPLSGRLVRTAKRLALGLKAPWIAVYVENQRHYHLSKKSQVSVERIMSLAESMGAETAVIQGENAADELIKYAEKNHVSKIVVGKSRRSRLKDMLFGSLAADLARRSTDTDIYVVAGEKRDEQKDKEKEKKKQKFVFQDFLVPFVQPAICTALAYPVRDDLNTVNIAMIFLMGTVLVATKFGKWAAIVNAIISTFAFNFFFIVPLYRIGAEDAEFLVALAVMVITTIIIWKNTNLLSLQVEYSRGRERSTHQLFGLTRELAATRGRVNMAEVAAKHIGMAFGGKASIWLANTIGVLEVISGVDEVLDAKEEGAAKWAFEHGQNSGLGTNTLPSAKGFYVPMPGASGMVGAIGIIPADESDLTSEQSHLLDAFAGIVASSIERADSADEAEKTRVQAETEKLRNLLLNSVSHELRNPLSIINNAAALLLNSPEKFAGEVERREMLRILLDQSSRLSKTVTNLIDVASLETGQVKLNKQIYFIEEIIGSALVRSEAKLEGREIRTEIEEGLPLVNVDGLLIEQVIVNMLENTISRCAKESVITIASFVNRGDVVVSVLEHGKQQAVDKKSLERPSAQQQVGEKQVLGIDITTSKGIVHAHGGQIWAIASRKGEGIVISFSLPAAKGQKTIEGNSPAAA